RYLPSRFFLLTTRRPQRSTLFPYTTLFRSERRDVTHVDLCTDDRAARLDRLQGSGDELAGGGEQDRGIERLRRRLGGRPGPGRTDRKSTRLNSSHVAISYAVFCLKKKKRK